ncbi:hypothetical protein DVW02_09120 [Clostridium botulinum]|nr:hypothetical protein [Clostridium botulinum]
MDERNATASWSGYLHQGKVGIFIGLKKINELINKPNQDLNKWKIEYESAEDIDIKNDDVVDSRHQVKAYKDAKYPNDYKDVLGILEYELDTNGKKVIKNKGFRICDFDDNLNTLPIEVNEDSRFLHTITETLGFGLTESEFNNTYKQAKYVENPNKIKLFEYPNGNRYCALSNFNDELKMYCKIEINKILIFKNHVFKNNTEQQENILNHIISYLDNEIRKKHNEGGDTYPELRFKEIYNLTISTDTYKKLNTDSIREIFVKSWVSFIQELNDSGIEYNRVQVEKIEKIVKDIYTWEDDRFIQFLKNINPDEDEIGSIDTIEDVTKLCKIDNLKYVFYQCLLQVEDEEFEVDKIGYKKDGGYILTAINKPKLIVKSIIKSIIKNSQVTNEIFDKSYLINGTIDNISFDNILDSTGPENGVKNNWGGLATEEDKFYNPKMKFISVERVKEKLNRE